MAKTYTIKFYEEDGAKADLVILEGFTEIGILTFCKARQKIKSVVFPSTMETLPEKLFKECSHLQSVDLGNSQISVIPKSIFYACKQLKQVILPRCITEIEEDAFAGCASLENIIIPNGIAEIGDRAFAGCDSLHSIDLPDSITKLGKGIFRYCDNLQSISLPSKLKKISFELFYRCYELQYITIPKLVTKIEGLAFFECYKLKIDTVPDSVTRIGESAFAWCTSINDFTIPKGVTEIGDGAFKYCRSLQNINIPDSVTKIGDSAFEYCKSLQSIVIPPSITKISRSIFEGCDLLNNITIPESVSTIWSEAFRYCKSLKSISMPNSITHIGESAFEGCETLQSVIIPDNVTKIGKSAFENCVSLQSIKIPNSVTEIGPRMLWGCNLDIFETESAHFKITCGLLIDKAKAQVISSTFTYLNEIEIPDGVTKIGDSAFEECKSLQSIILPDSVTEIGENAFSECELLQNIILPVSVSKVKRSAFYRCDSLKFVTITNPQIDLWPWSFGNCKELTTVNLPKGLSWTKIKDYFQDSPWGKMSPKAAIAAQKEAEEKAQKEALRVRQEKVREMSVMAASFVIKQAFEMTFKSETSVTVDQGNQWFDINLELVQGVMLKIRMPVVIEMDKVQDYSSKLVEKISQLKSIFDGVFAGQSQKANLISISIPSFEEGGGISANVRMNLNQICTKAGNQICFKSEKEDLNFLLSVGSDLADTFKKLDDFTDISGEYELNLKNKTYGVGVCLNKALQTVPTVSIPQFVTEVSRDSFNGCDKLVEISIPRSTEMSGWPFGECRNLKNINLY